MLWRHPRLDATALAAGPDGRGVALVGASPQASPTSGVSSFLYLLSPDGSVRMLDTISNDGVLATPTFLRAPTDPSGPVRLYWIREHDESAYDPSRPRDWKQLWTSDGATRRRVEVGLRLDEWPYEIHAYPGTPLFSLTTFRRDNSPTREEVLLDNDARETYGAGLASLVHFESLVNTDLPDSVAWPDPREVVVIVAEAAHPASLSLRLYRVGCQYYGSHLVRGRRGLSVYPQNPRLWPLLPGPAGSVLVLGTGDGLARDVWSRVDVASGAATATHAAWAAGAWTFVQPARAGGWPTSARQANCGKYSWQYP